MPSDRPASARRVTFRHACVIMEACRTIVEKHLADRKRHWEKTWAARATQETSWYQACPQPSLAMIARSGTAPDEALIDVGGGDSPLVGRLLALGYSDLTVLDISGTALGRARERLGESAKKVRWIETDVTEFEPSRRYRLWHDRAAFHFLTEAEDRQRYVRVLRAALSVGGQCVIATFARAGPRRCSGLEVVRYDAESLAQELGPGFQLREEADERHRTPAGREQRFTWCRFRREG